MTAHTAVRTLSNALVKTPGIRVRCARRSIHGNSSTLPRPFCVVADHGGPALRWRMHTGSQAVQMFYIISGFYMGMVLSSRYSKPHVFYVSRFLRIFPPYWLVLAATFVLGMAGGLFFNRWLMLRTYVNHPFEHNGMVGILLSVLVNLTLIGQDWLMFLKHDI